jgi:murein DD-endopeptidase MepM/ murein hydrolase activator NlpD
MLRSRTATYGFLLVLAVAALVGAASLTFQGLGRGNPDASPATPDAPPNSGPIAVATTPAGQPTEGPPTDGRPTTPGPSPTIGPRPTDGLPHKSGHPRSVEPTELTGYVWPLRNALISSRMAPRDFGGFVIVDGKEIHDGLDLNTHCGDKVRAAHDGTVLYAGRDFDVFLGYRGDAQQIYDRLEDQGRVNTLPIVIVIDDGNGYRSIYVHLNRADVEAGAVVRAGDIIGLEGATGYATGCHLHYGLIRMDAGWQQVVPRLSRFGYPPLVRERIDPLDVLPWGDQYAPQRLQDRANATPTPSAVPAPTGSPGS